MSLKSVWGILSLGEIFVLEEISKICFLFVNCSGGIPIYCLFILVSGGYIFSSGGYSHISLQEATHRQKNY